MSKIALKPNDSGTATFEIQAPATNTNRVLELPDEAGKILSDVSDIEAQVKTATNASGSAPVYAARAWVNFDGTNGSIRASGNVSSVTRLGDGEYRINYSISFPTNNYCPVAGINRDATSGTNSVPFLRNRASSSIDVRCRNGNNGGLNDPDMVAVSIFA